MDTLIIMRHAEAVSATPGADDFSRPLTGTGRAAAERAAQRLRAGQPVPQLLLHSPAVRTAETARILAQSLCSPALRIQAVPAIYLARGRTLQELLAQPEHAADCVLLVGHNPGVSELLQLLSDADARTRRWLTPGEFVALTRRARAAVGGSRYSAPQKQ
jgi:phosphohistidine phosphatase